MHSCGSITLLGLLWITSTAGAQGEFDGRWSGTDSTGESIRFDVCSDIITDSVIEYRALCPSGAIALFGGSFLKPGAAIGADGQFQVTQGVGQDPGGTYFIAPGESIPILVQGQFSGAMASGTTLVGIAAFSGQGLNIEICFYQASWSASRTEAGCEAKESGPTPTAASREAGRWTLQQGLPQP